MNTLFEAASAKDIYDKYYTEEFPEKVYIRILMMDPTAKNVDSQDLTQIKKGKYTDWLVKQFLNKTDDDKLLMLNEDAEAIYEALQLFNKLTNTKVGTENLQKLITEYSIHVKDAKDINSYSTNELRLLSSAYEQSKTTLARPASEKEKDIEIIYEDELYKVLIPKTRDAARKYGTGTSWCTATSNNKWFIQYTETNREHGPLCIIIDKTAAPPNNKWQYHKASGQFMDYQDHRISQFMFITRQIRKGPKYEDSIDLVAEAIEKRFDDPSWNYDNISDEGSVIHEIQQALQSSDKRIGDRIVSRLISEQELNPTIVTMLVNDYDVVFTFENVENILTTEPVSVPTLDAVLVNMGWSKTSILNRILANQARYSSKEIDWSNTYLLEYFTSDLTQSQATKLLMRAVRKLFSTNLLSRLGNTSIDSLLATLLTISSSSLQEARRVIKTQTPEEVLRKGLETSLSVNPIDELKQLILDHSYVYPKTTEVLQRILNIDNIITQHPLWTATEIVKTNETKALVFKVSRKGWKSLYATGTPIETSTQCISQSEAALAIALHLTPDLTKTADSDERWTALVQHGFLQGNINDKLVGSSIVVYILTLFNIQDYDLSAVPNILKSISSGVTVGNVVYFYNKFPTLKLSDVTSDEATLSTESSDFNESVAEIFQKKYAMGYTSNRSVSKAICLLSRSPLMDIQCPFDIKQPDIVVGAEASLPLRDAIVTLQNRRRTK